MKYAIEILLLAVALTSFALAALVDMDKITKAIVLHQGFMCLGLGAIYNAVDKKGQQ